MRQLERIKIVKNFSNKRARSHGAKPKSKARFSINWEVSIFNIVTLLISAAAFIRAQYNDYLPSMLTVGPADHVLLWADKTDTSQVPTIRLAISTSYLNKSSSTKFAVIHHESAALSFPGRQSYFESYMQASFEYLKNPPECPNQKLTVGDVVTTSSGSKLIGCWNAVPEKIRLFDIRDVVRVFSGGDGAYRQSLFRSSAHRCEKPLNDCPDSTTEYVPWSELQSAYQTRSNDGKYPPIELQIEVTLIDGRTATQQCNLQISDIERTYILNDGFVEFDRCSGSKVQTIE